jgi:hypothetical protein
MRLPWDLPPAALGNRENPPDVRVWVFSSSFLDFFLFRWNDLKKFTYTKIRTSSNGGDEIKDTG